MREDESRMSAKVISNSPKVPLVGFFPQTILNLSQILSLLSHLHRKSEDTRERSLSRAIKETSLHRTDFKHAGRICAFLQYLITTHASVGLQLHQNISQIIETFRLLIKDKAVIEKYSQQALVLPNKSDTPCIRTPSSQQSTTRLTVTVIRSYSYMLMHREEMGHNSTSLGTPHKSAFSFNSSIVATFKTKLPDGSVSYFKRFANCPLEPDRSQKCL